MIGVSRLGFVACAFSHEVTCAFSSNNQVNRQYLIMVYNWCCLLSYWLYFISLSGATYFLGRTISAVPWGMFADKYGRKPCIVISILSVYGS